MFVLGVKITWASVNMAMTVDVVVMFMLKSVVNRGRTGVTNLNLSVTISVETTRI